MPSNDTENIYATQYGGEGEPIPATKISYDGTGTSIEATTVQAAITEVDTDLQSTKEDVSDIKTALRDGCIISDLDYKVNVAGDGTKTWGDLFDEAYTQFTSDIAALEDDEVIVIKHLYIEGMATLSFYDKTEGYINTDTSPALIASRISVNADSFTLYGAKLGTSKYLRYVVTTNVPAVTITDKLSEVPTSGTKLRIEGWKLKLI